MSFLRDLSELLGAWVELCDDCIERDGLMGHVGYVAALAVFPVLFPVLAVGFYYGRNPNG